MKLTLLGGGGFRVPLVYKALMADESPERVTQVRLYDVDPERLTAIGAVLRELAAGHPEAPEIIITTDLPSALEGTDFIFSAIRVGGTRGRSIDEAVCLGHGIIGQETVGAGGISYALRGIPVALDLVDQIRQHAPHAWVINFTNPAGVITQVMRQGRHGDDGLGGRVVGICDSPVGLARRVLATLQKAGLVPEGVGEVGLGGSGIQMDYLGLNHLGWLQGLRVHGVDVLPRLLKRPDLVESFEEGRLFGAGLCRALGAVPNEYLHYYYFGREDLAADLAAESPRGKFLEAQQINFYARVARIGDAPGAYSAWEETRMERERTYMASNREASGSFERDLADLDTGGYDRVALAIMHAIANDVPAQLVLNVPNLAPGAGVDGGPRLIPELEDDDIVETPCLIDASGIRPLPTLGLPDHARGMVVNAKFVERRTIEAALTGSREAALMALLHHPLVDSWNVANRLLDELVALFPQLSYLR